MSFACMCGEEQESMIGSKQTSNKACGFQEPEKSIFRCKFSSLKVVADGYTSDHSGFSQAQRAILMPQLGGSVKPWNWATIF
ncbi:unnamed protein product [Sphagnum jensenii]|uniref:Uncharacterized protein n=1 Tax=Sphagnum jensenii TaxID=128206 RepID=A0ABP1AF65_9BRYO